MPFEVKYRDTALTPARLKGMRQFMHARGVTEAYVITQRGEEFGRFSLAAPGLADGDAQVVAIPAPLACYWMSEA